MGIDLPGLIKLFLTSWRLLRLSKFETISALHFCDSVLYDVISFKDYNVFR